MKTISTAYKSGMAILCLALLLGACRSPTLTASPPLGTPAAETPTPPPSAAPPTPALTFTMLLSLTPSPSLTPTLLPTSTPVPPTWTPLPTLPPTEAKARVLKLLQDNGGCKLPCWWGITPGQADWNTTRHFLETFVKNIELIDEGDIIRNDLLIHWMYYVVRYKNDHGFEDSISVMVGNGIITYIFVRGIRLHQLLTENGAPDEVYISAHRYTNTGDIPPFYFLVYYGHKGFWAQFDLNGIVGYKIIRGCPQSVDPLRIWLGSPDWKWELNDILDYVFGPPFPGSPPSRYPILTLKEATGMDLDTFTNIFKDTNNQKCLETPADLWN